MLERKPHPEQGFRSCLGIIRLAKIFGNNRLSHLEWLGLLLDRETSHRRERRLATSPSCAIRPALMMSIIALRAVSIAPSCSSSSKVPGLTPMTIDRDRPSRCRQELDRLCDGSSGLSR
jgi:hypothetical protein